MTATADTVQREDRGPFLKTNKALLKAGFAEISQHGVQVKLRNPEGRTAIGHFTENSRQERCARYSGRPG
jgi:hypothetical protein